MNVPVCLSSIICPRFTAIRLISRLPIKIFLIIVPLYIPLSVDADTCPGAAVVKAREISRDYEWSMDERLTLDDVLSVEALYSIRIKNNGEFVACYYAGSEGLVRLDGKPATENCLIMKNSGRWRTTENSEQVCEEKDLSLCLYQITCPDPEAVHQ